MDITRAAKAAAVATFALWTAKAVAIDLAGGLGKSPAESPLFLLGLACAVVGSVLLGVAVSRRGGSRHRTKGVLVALAPTVAGVVASSVVPSLQPTHPGWVWGEVNLWAIMLTLLALALVLLRRSTGADAPVRRTQRQRRPSMNLR